MIVRPAILNDLSIILDIYATARNFMRNTGNADQWKNIYPPKDLLEKDIEN